LLLTTAFEDEDDDEYEDETSNAELQTPNPKRLVSGILNFYGLSFASLRPWPT